MTQPVVFVDSPEGATKITGARASTLMDVKHAVELAVNRVRNGEQADGSVRARWSPPFLQICQRQNTKSVFEIGSGTIDVPFVVDDNGDLLGTDLYTIDPREFADEAARILVNCNQPKQHSKTVPIRDTESNEVVAQICRCQTNLTEKAYCLSYRDPGTDQDDHVYTATVGEALEHFGAHIGPDQMSRLQEIEQKLNATTSVDPVDMPLQGTLDAQLTPTP